VDTKKAISLAAVAVIAILSSYATSGILSEVERSALVVLVTAAGLWTTEAVPLVATSFIIPLLQTLLGIQSFKAALTPFFDPVVMLLLGGFLLALAVEKNDLDEFFAYQMISKFKADARFMVLIFMVTTAFLSMWISNTASTALMLTMALRLTETVKDKRGNFSKILVLSIAYSATAGGLSTLVGTTTCAMAAGFLKDMIGYEITFLGWMGFGLPITLLMVLTIWVVLLAIFPIDVEEITSLSIHRKPLTEKGRLTLVVFIFSILLWITGRLPEPITQALGWSGHGLSSSVVAGIIAVLLFASDIIDERDLGRANWSTLLLIGGGLSLGGALDVSGLVLRISDSLMLLTAGRPEIGVIALVAMFGLGISIFASNTASAGILLPIAISLGSTTSISPIILAVVIGISTSLDFMLPVGTPPNAIAYSTGKVSMRDMIKAGFALDVIGVTITIFLASYLWPYLI